MGLVVVVGRLAELVHAASISVIATIATRPSLRIALIASREGGGLAVPSSRHTRTLVQVTPPSVVRNSSSCG